MDKKVLIIGEFCEDKFVYGTCKRLNPEAPTPVFIPDDTIVNIGMAGNTYMNLKHLGLSVDYPELCTLNRISKTRFVDKVSNYILLRCDENEFIDKGLTFDMVNEMGIDNYDAIVVSDYNKGLVSKKLLDKIFFFAKAKGIPTFMDTKKNIGDWADECDFIKINENEFNNPNHNYILKSGTFRENLIVTLGGNGAMWNNNIYETNQVSVRDVVGAGDTFLAGLVYGYLKNNDIEEAIKIANRLASNVVTKKGVALPNKKLL